MRLTERYLPRKVFDQYVLIPVGQAVMENKKVIRLNETGYIIACMLLEDLSFDELLTRAEREYGMSEEIISTFITGVRRYNVIEI